MKIIQSVKLTILEINLNLMNKTIECIIALLYAYVPLQSAHISIIIKTMNSMKHKLTICKILSIDHQLLSSIKEQKLKLEKYFDDEVKAF